MSGGVRNPDQLALALNSVCFDVCNDYLDDVDFNTELTVRLDPDLTPDTPEVRAVLAAFPSAFVDEHGPYLAYLRTDGALPTLSVRIDAPARVGQR